MRFVLFNGEKSVNDLATRVFQPQGPDATAVTKRAVAALLKANPQLSKLTKVPAGSLIAVPDDAPAIPADQQAVAVQALRAQAAQTVQDALNTLQQRLADIESSAASRLETVTGPMQAADFKTALKNLAAQHPEMAKLLPDPVSAAKAAAGITKSVQSAQALRKASLAQISESLALFARK